MKRSGYIARRTRLRPVNPERRRKLFAKQYGGPYADWIRSQPCLIYGRTYGHGHPALCRGAIEAAHTTGKNNGGKASDLIPLCHYHHIEELHRHGPKTFAKRYNVDLREQARLYWERGQREAAA